jgi:hypothetical protein
MKSVVDLNILLENLICLAEEPAFKVHVSSLKFVGVSGKELTRVSSNVLQR